MHCTLYAATPLRHRLNPSATHHTPIPPIVSTTCQSSGHTSAATLVQRFGSALNLNVHFHLLFLDGVYLADGADPPVFGVVSEPGAKRLQALVEQIALRIGRALERRGLIERELENACLAADSEAGPLDDLIGHPINCRIAWVRGRSRSSSRYRRCRPGRRRRRASALARLGSAGSRCTRAPPSRPSSAAGSGRCSVT
jgi:hypothetical protein